jgi:hypothetical protein
MPNLSDLAKEGLMYGESLQHNMMKRIKMKEVR